MSFPKFCEQFWGASQALCTAPHSRGHLPPWICNVAAYWVPLNIRPSAASLQSRGKLDSQSQQRRWEVYYVGSGKRGRLLPQKKLPRLVKCSPTRDAPPTSQNNKSKSTCVGFRSISFWKYFWSIYRGVQHEDSRRSSHLSVTYNHSPFVKTKTLLL